MRLKICSLLLLQSVAHSSWRFIALTSSVAAFVPNKNNHRCSWSKNVASATPENELVQEQQQEQQLQNESELRDAGYSLQLEQAGPTGAIEAGHLDDDDDEAAFLRQTKVLCEQRNIALEKIKNARDLASISNSPIRPGRVFRMGKVSDATAQDVQCLFQELKIQTLVDLRSPTELKDDKTLLRKDVFGSFTDVVWIEQGRKKRGCVKVLPPGKSPVKTKKVNNGINRGPRSFWRRHFGKQKEEVVQALETKDDDDDEEFDWDFVVTLNDLADADEDNDDDDDDGADDDAEDCPVVLNCADSTPASTGGRKERHFVSLMNEFKYVRGTLSKVRKRDIARSLLKSPGALVSRRVRTSLKKPFIKEINDGGLPMLNELLLRFGAPGIRYVLELCADASRHPIAFYCTAGKDRTGMIAAIILGLCGASPKSIVEDYTLSANVYAEMNDNSAMVGALSQRNLDPKTFLGAPAHVMRDTLEAITEEYGSVEGYCNWIGFGPEQQEKLKKALMTTT